MKFIVVFLTLTFFIGPPLVAQKMTADEIVAKNLGAIGSAEDRAKMNNVTAVGDVEFTKSTSTKTVSPGKVVFASEGNKVLFAMNFPSSIYQTEKIVFDGKDHSVDFSQPGLRSIIGDYLWRYDTIIRHGLLGGVLSKGWGLIDIASHNAKVSYDGTKKLDGREVYVLSYEPKKGSDVRIKLFFEKETFRHVRTEYRRLNSAGASNNPNTASSLTETHEDMTEDFSDFKTEYGITMPRVYKLHVYVERNRANYESFYTCTFKDFYYNSKFDAATFNTSSR